MHIVVEHETAYSYGAPARSTIQYLRMTPRQHANQSVRSWQVTGPAKFVDFIDGFGNIVHVLSLTKPHETIVLRVRGEVHTTETHGVLPPENERCSPQVYAMPTRLTRVEGELAEFTGGMRAALAKDRLTGLHDLMVGLHKQVAYRLGVTDVESTASEAFRNGEGVCQDQAHIFLAVCRAAGIPARYVSGYMWTDSGGRDYDANHAWAEAWVPDLGWVSFDVANGISTTASYVRVAHGRDYLDAAPVRGVRRGGGEEAMRVSVRVTDGQQ